MTTSPSVLDYLIFSDLAYQYAPDFWGATPTATLGVPSGWSVGESTASQWGLTAYSFVDLNPSDAAYKDVVIAYRGSVSLHDWAWTDAEIATGFTPGVFYDALHFAQQIEEWYPASDGYTYSVTGHSLGGAEAEVVAAALGLGGATFAAPGVSDMLVGGSTDNAPLLTDYVIANDPFGSFGTHVGEVHSLPATVDPLEDLIAAVIGGEAAGALGAILAPAILNVIRAHPLSIYGDVLAAQGDILSNPLSPEQNAGAPLSQPTSGGITFTVSQSSVSATYTVSSDQNGNSTSTRNGVSASVGLSLDGVDVGLNVPATVPVVASTGLYDWSDPAAWGDGYLLVQGTADVVNLINGVEEDDLSAITGTINSLSNFGPTAQSAFTIPVATLDLFGVPINFGVSISLVYDVTIPQGAWLLLDQQNVTLDALTIAAGGALFGNSNNLSVAKNLSNDGTLQLHDLSAGGTFLNGGTLGLRSLSVGGTLDNEGTAVISGGGSANALVNDVEFEVRGGTFQPGSIFNGLGAILAADNSATLIGQGTIDNRGQITLGSTGDRTYLAAPAPYLVTSPSTFGGNQQTVLSGGGLVALSDNANNFITGNIEYWGNGIYTSSTLVNADNTIRGAGTIGAADSSYNGLAFVNRALVDAEGSNSLRITADTRNLGVLQASSGGTLQLFGTVDNTSGTIQALSGSEVDLRNVASGGTILVQDGGRAIITNGAVSGSTLEAVSGSGTISVQGGTVFDSVTVGSSTTVTATDQSTIYLQGTLDNHGRIALASTGDRTYLVVPAPYLVTSPSTFGGNQQTVLSGGGLVALSDNANNFITGNIEYWGNGIYTSSTLVNADNTIRGAGTIGAADSSYNGLAFVNRALVDAEGSNSLRITADTRNLGVLQASSGGTLQLFGTVDNTSGTIQALSGSEVDLRNVASGGTILVQDGGRAIITNGAVSGSTLEAVGTGSIMTQGGVLDSVVIATSTTVNVQSGTTLSLQGTIDNRGQITLGSTGDRTYLAAPAPYLVTSPSTFGGNQQTVLSGGGLVALSDNANNFITGNIEYWGNGIYTSSTLVNADNTIRGAGTIGAADSSYNGLAFINRALVDAEGSNPLKITANTQNFGVLQASSGGTLQLYAAGFDNTSGTIQALSGSEVDLSASFSGGIIVAQDGSRIVDNGSTISGSTLEAVGTGSIMTQGGVLDSVVIATSTTVNVQSGTTLSLQGTIDNRGQITLGSTGDRTYLAAPAPYLVTSPSTFGGNQQTVLSGGGLVALSDNANNFITGNIEYWGNGIYTSSTLVNADNTIRGAGTIGAADSSYNGLAFVNRALVDAEGSNSLRITADTRNLGVLQASSGGTLQLFGTVDNTSGTIQALSGSEVDLRNVASGGTILVQDGGRAIITNGAVSGSTLEAVSGSGTISVQGGTVFDSVTVGSSTTVTATDQSTIYLQGTLDNHGRIALASTGDRTYLVVPAPYLVTSPSTFGGNQQTVLSGGGLVALSDNANNFITGNIEYWGNGIYTSSTLVNADNTIRGAGTIGAADSSYNGLAFVNQAQGVIEASGSNPLNVATADGSQNRGTMEAASGGRLQFRLNGTLDNTSGLIQALSGGSVEFDNGAIDGGTILAQKGGIVTIFGGATISANVSVLTGGSLYLSAGASCTGVTVSSGGTEIVGAGASAGPTVVQSGGTFEVVSGATWSGVNLTAGAFFAAGAGYIGSGLTFTSGSNFKIDSGGTGLSNTIQDGSRQVVLSAGLASATSIGSGGVEVVSSGGTIRDTLVGSDGTLDLQGGALVSGTTSIGAGATLLIESSFSLSSFIVSSGVTLQVGSGGVASNTTVLSGGTLLVTGGLATGTIVASGAIVNGASVASGQTMIVSAGQATTDTSILNGGTLIVQSGGAASRTLVSSGGSEVIYGGGSVTSSMVSSGGLETLSSGASASGTVVSAGGKQWLFGSGIASGTTLSKAGQMEIWSGGIGRSTVVSNGGLEVIDAGGTTSGTTVSSGGLGYVYGIASGVVVVDGGVERIGVGGVLSGGTLSNFGSAVLSSGGLAKALSATSRGEVDVLTGGIASGTILSANGRAEILSGGIGRSTVIGSGGLEVVDAGGTTSGTTVSSGGLGYAYGIASGTMIVDGGLERIGVGGVLSGGALLNFGNVLVSSGGLATGLTATSRGEIDVLSGGIASGTILSANGRTEILSGGIGRSTVIGSGGQEVVDAGATTSGTTVSSGGLGYVYGIASGTTIVDGGLERIGVGGVLSGGTLSNFGSALVSSGGLATGLTATSRGEIDVLNGGIASGTILSANGRTEILSGGVGRSTVIGSGGQEVVDAGATTSGTTVSSGGLGYVYGIASGTTIVDGGLERIGVGGVLSGGALLNFGNVLVSSGGLATGLTATSRGEIDVLSGGIASGTILSANGRTEILSGGIGRSTVIGSGGLEVVDVGATTSGTTVSSGGLGYVYGIASGTTIVDGGLERIGVGGVLSGGALSNFGSALVSSGGLAKGLTATSRGEIDVLNGGIASGTILSANGRTEILSGGIGRSTVIGSGGQEVVDAGATTSGTTVSSGGLGYVYGIASGTTIVDGGLERIGVGGVLSGGALLNFGNVLVSSGGLATGLTATSRGEIDVLSGGIASGTILSANGRTEILSGGIGRSTVIGSGGLEVVDAGATTSGTTVSSGGLGYVYGIASGTTIVDGGLERIGVGGVLSGGALSNFGSALVSSGGLAKSLTATSRGEIDVLNGGIASGTILSANGRTEILSGGIGRATVVGNGGVEVVDAAATASGTTVSSGGSDYVYGIAIGATVVDGGLERISVGGVLSGGVASNFGDVVVSSGATASGVTATSHGLLDVHNGGVASAALVSSGGQLEVWSGGIGRATVVGSGGLEVVDTGATASGTAVSSGGVDYVYGTASNTTVSSGGAEYIGQGGVLSGATLSGGLLEIKSGGSAGTSQIAFTSAGGTLQLDDAQHFSGTISGFGVPGGIDLRDVSFGPGTTLGYSGDAASGVLTVGDGTHTATIHLLGQYTVGNFIKQSDGNGGTLITDPPIVATVGSPFLAVLPT